MTVDDMKPCTLARKSSVVRGNSNKVAIGDVVIGLHGLKPSVGIFVLNLVEFVSSLFSMKKKSSRNA
jgi:hypothetical protein